jgi:polysaccharide export outer membrane protein
VLKPTTVVFVLLGALAMGCANKAASYPYFAQEPDPRRKPYVIGVADVLNITVWKDQELSSEARVRPDGTITMPLVGELRAAGRTADDLRQEIANKLTQYVKQAIVTVAVTEVNSYVFTVSGNVGQPGVYSAKHFVTVAEAIALAGGPNRYASSSDVEIIRQDHGKPRRIPIDYDSILHGDHPEQDIAVNSGDMIWVP